MLIVFLENCVDSELRRMGAGGLHDISNGYGSLISALIEVFRRQSVGPHLIQNRTPASPFGKSGGCLDRLSPIQLVGSLVLIRASNDSVVGYLLDDA